MMAYNTLGNIIVVSVCILLLILLEPLRSLCALTLIMLVPTIITFKIVFQGYTL